MILYCLHFYLQEMQIGTIRACGFLHTNLFFSVLIVLSLFLTPSWLPPDRLANWVISYAPNLSLIENEKTSLQAFTPPFILLFLTLGPFSFITSKSEINRVIKYTKQKSITHRQNAKKRWPFDSGLILIVLDNKPKQVLL